MLTNTESKKVCCKIVIRIKESNATVPNISQYILLYFL